MHVKAPCECSTAIQGHSLVISVLSITHLLQVVELPAATEITWKLICFKVYPGSFVPYEALSLRYKALPVPPHNHGFDHIP